MAQEERAQPSMTSLPRVEDLPIAEQGYDADRVRDAFEAFRRHAVQLQAQLRVLQAAGQGSQVEPTGHAIRMDALHLIREAAEFADVLERDAQRASAAQLGKTEQEVRRRQSELGRRETEVERFRQESERQRAEIVNAARNEARQLLADANRQATQELREAEARGAKLLEQSRHQATELTNSARAEVEQTLEWARGQASAIMQRAQQGAEQMLRAAGMGDEALAEVTESIRRAAELEIGGNPSAPPAAEAPPKLESVGERAEPDQQERPARRRDAPPPPSSGPPPPAPVAPESDSADEPEAEAVPDTDEDGDESRS
jgi:F0F1-type ATP synthase membrane subunit b/b'